MKLRQLLDTKDFKGINIKIHCVSGTSHIYAYENDGRVMTPYFEKLHIQTVNNLKHTKHKLLHLDERFDKIIENIENNKRFKYKTWRISKALKRKEKMKVLYEKQIADLQKYIKIPYYERKVLDVYEGQLIDEQPCKIIVIEGCEQGKYWLISEFIKKQLKGGANTNE